MKTILRTYATWSKKYFATLAQIAIVAVIVALAPMGAQRASAQTAENVTYTVTQVSAGEFRFDFPQGWSINGNSTKLQFNTLSGSTQTEYSTASPDTFTLYTSDSVVQVFYYYAGLSGWTSLWADVPLVDGQTNTTPPPPPPTDIYDNAYQTTDKLEVKYTSNGCMTDTNITFNWVTLINDDTKYPSYVSQTDIDLYQASFNASISDADMAITQITSWNGASEAYLKYVEVAWVPPSSNMTYTWSTDRITTSGAWGVNIQCEYPGDVRVVPSGSGNTGYYVSNPSVSPGSAWATDIRNFLWYDTDYQYPNGYGGILAQDEYTSPVTIEDMTNEMTVAVKVTGKEVQFWNTTPTPPITIHDRCKFILYEADGITEVWDSDYGATCEMVHTVNVNEFGSYVLQFTVMRDITGDGLPDEPTGMFTTPVQVKGTNYEMTAGSDWTDITDGVLMSECIVQDDSFVNVIGCIENLKYVGTILSFDTIKFGETWSPNDQCRQLTVLDDWLGLPGITVCPQISSEVRGIVTPFITLAMGLTVITFIARKAGNDVL